MSNQLDQRIRQAMQHVVDEAPPPPEIPTPGATAPAERSGLSNWIAALASAAVILVVVGGAALLFGTNDTDVGGTAASTAAVVSPPSVQTLSVTVSGVSGRMGDEFAAVLYEGDDLSNLDREALGGFWAVISSDDQSLTEVVRQPGEFHEERFPYVSDAALTVEPGTYTLVLWVDETLTPVSRWVPINSYVPGDPLTEGMDLYGCHMVFDVGDDQQTEVVVPANLHHNGWNVDCVTGVAIPGTDAAAAVNPYGLP